MGKTSLVKRLLGEILNITESHLPVDQEVSTGQAEAHQVLISQTSESVHPSQTSESVHPPQTSESVHIPEEKDEAHTIIITQADQSPKENAPKASEANWKSLRDEGEKDKEIAKEISILLKLIREMNIESLDSSLKSSPKEDTASPSASDGQDPDQPSKAHSSDATPRGSNEESEKDTDSLPQASDDPETRVSDDIHRMFEQFDELRFSPDDPELAKLAEAIMVKLIDTGGQTAFLELLPMLALGPALYLLCINGIKHLREEVTVHFKTQGDSTAQPCDGYTFTSEEVVFQILSSVSLFSDIDSTSEAKEQTTSQESASSTRRKSVALLFATFYDQAKKDEELMKVLKQNEKELSDILFDKQSQSYREGLVEPAQRDPLELLFKIDNRTGTQEDIAKLREKLEKIMTSVFEKRDIPAAWFILGLFLKKVGLSGHRSILKVRECYEIASHLKLSPRDADFALKYLHKCLAMVMYFPQIDHPWLKERVICDPQVVFDSISKLVFNAFQSSNTILPKAVIDDFKEKGEFSISDLETCTAKVSGVASTQDGNPLFFHSMLWWLSWSTSPSLLQSLVARSRAAIFSLPSCRVPLSKRSGS